MHLAMFVGQLSCKTPRYFSLTTIRMQWNYFGLDMERESTMAWGLWSSVLLHQSSWILKVLKLQNAHDVEWLTWKMSNDGKNRLFVEVRADEVDRTKSYGCKTVKGTRSTHCVLGFSRKDTTQLLLRSLSCFCSMCIDEAWDKCINLSIVEPWKLQKLEPERQDDIEDGAFKRYCILQPKSRLGSFIGSWRSFCSVESSMKI